MGDDMTLIYIHGVKVRSKGHGEGLAKPFRRWLSKKSSAPNGNFTYLPVYWGDKAATFGWELKSRPESALLRMGVEDDQKFKADLSCVGLMRQSPAEILQHREDDIGGGSVLTPGSSAAPQSIDLGLSAYPEDNRADLVSDLYLAIQRKGPGIDQFIEDPRLSELADISADIADDWDTILSETGSEEAAVDLMIRRVEEKLPPLSPDQPLTMGWDDTKASVGEFFKRALAMPGDALSLVAGELRPAANRFVSYFIGDVLTYIDRRGEANAPGEIPTLVLDALKTAHQKRKDTGEPIIVLTHSMGGQLLYDAVQHFADHDPELSDLMIDHWITCGAQVSLFAEMGLLKGQPQPGNSKKLPRPARVSRWTNFYDVNDVVGFVMAPVFDGVRDISYDTGYGLAFAHTGFLARASFFKAVEKQLVSV